MYSKVNTKHEKVIEPNTKSRSKIRISSKWDIPGKEINNRNTSQKSNTKLSLSTHSTCQPKCLPPKPTVWNTDSSKLKNTAYHSREESMQLIDQQMQLLDHLQENAECSIKPLNRMLNRRPRNEISNTLQPEIKQADTPICFKEFCKYPKAQKNSVNEKISLTRLKSNEAFEKKAIVEKSSELTTTVSDFIGLLEIKTNSVNKQILTSSSAYIPIATQTEIEPTNCSCRVDKECKTTQVSSPLSHADHLGHSNFNQIIHTFLQDCEKLIHIWKLHKHYANHINLGVINTPNKGNILHDDFANVVYDLFQFHRNILEVPLNQSHNMYSPRLVDKFSYEHCDSRFQVEDNVGLSLKNEYVYCLKESIFNLNDSIKQLNIIASNIQNANTLSLEESQHNAINKDVSNCDNKSIAHNNGAVVVSNTNFDPMLPANKARKSIVTKDCEGPNQEVHNDKEIKQSILQLDSKVIKLLKNMERCDNTPKKTTYLDSNNKAIKKTRSLNKIEQSTSIFIDKQCIEVRRCQSENILETLAQKDLHKVKKKIPTNFETVNIPQKCSDNKKSHSDSKYLTEVSTKHLIFVKSDKTAYNIGDNKLKSINLSKELDRVSSASTNTPNTPRCYSKHFHQSANTAGTFKRKYRRQKQLRSMKSKHSFKTYSCASYKMTEFHSTFATSCSLDSPLFPLNNKKLVVLCQSPSVGNLKYVCKEFDKDSAIILNTCSSSEYDTPSSKVISPETFNQPEIKNKTEYVKTIVNDTDVAQYTRQETPNDIKYLDASIQTNVKKVNTCIQSYDVQLDTESIQKDIHSRSKDVCNDPMVDWTVKSGETEYEIRNDLISKLNLALSHPCEEIKMNPSQTMKVQKHGRESTQCDFSYKVFHAVKQNCTKFSYGLLMAIRNCVRILHREDKMYAYDVNRHLETCYNSCNHEFDIENVRCIGKNSVLIKWKNHKLNVVCGYDILINNQSKAKIYSALRTSAIIDFLAPKSTLYICVRALTQSGEVDGIAKTTFKMN